MRKTFLAVAAAAAIFGPTLGAGFHLDDFALFQDPRITSPSCCGFGPTRPLTWFTFWVNYQLGGEQPLGYHVVNLVLHLASVAVAGDVFGRLLADRRLAGIAVALFALHPLQTEAVSYVFARATLLMAFFCLLSLREWLRGRRWRAAAWFVPALLAKEECVSFPFLLWLLAGDRKPPRQVPAMLGLSLLAGLRVWIAAGATAGSGAGAQSGIAPFDYLLTQGLALLRYLRLLVLPYGLTPDPPLSVTTGWQAYAAWIALAGAAAFLWRWPERRWIAAAVILIAPSSSIFPAEDLAADRRLYLPMIGLAAAAAFPLVKIPRWTQVAVLGILAIVSLRQALLWRDGTALWLEAVRIAPHKTRPRLQLARRLPPQEALRVLGDESQTFDVASMKGSLHLTLGQPAEALAEFGRALAMAPHDARALNNRGVALLELGQREAAIADFRRALALDACLFDARWNLKRLGIDYPPGRECRYTPAQGRALAGGG